MTTMVKSAATQLYRIVINARAQAIWDAITLPDEPRSMVMVAA
jgi:hypothetical protein